MPGAVLVVICIQTERVESFLAFGELQPPELPRFSYSHVRPTARKYTAIPFFISRLSANSPPAGAPHVPVPSTSSREPMTMGYMGEHTREYESRGEVIPSNGTVRLERVHTTPLYYITRRPLKRVACAPQIAEMTLPTLVIKRF